MAHILIVDDDATQLRVRRQLLELAGHQVSAASTAPDAATQLAESPPDVLLMDLRLPRVRDGVALIRAAGAQPVPPRIVVLSGWPEELYDLPEAQQVAHILVKPTPTATLLDIIKGLAMLFLCLLALAGGLHAQSFPFDVARPAEVVAELEIASPGSDWSQPGREAALAVLTLDGRAPQHLMLWAGPQPYTYRAFLGALAAGPHELRIHRDPRHSAPAAGLEVRAARFREVPREHPDWPVLAHAPILYARADTIGGFTDIPLLAYCERLTEAGRPLLQYTVVFSNEDGGTSTRALMARWGRTTDIEYIYRAWLDPSGGVLRATIQAKDHEEIEFRGRREGSHPILIPVTRNNMVAGEGVSPIRYQLPPELVDLSSASREHVMDAHPLTWRAMAQELQREGKLRPFGRQDGEKTGDPRNYLYVEMKLTNRGSAVAVYARLRGESIWRGSHRGRVDYAISRDGWVRTTIELPPGTRPGQVEEFGFDCLVAAAKPQPQYGTCRIEAVSKVFPIGPDYAPAPSFWSLDTPVELPTGLMRAFPAGAPARNPLSGSW